LKIRPLVLVLLVIGGIILGCVIGAISLAAIRGELFSPPVSTESPQPSQTSSTLSPTFGPQDFSIPPTILTYIEDVRMGQTTRIEFLNPKNHEQVVITTIPTIQAIVELLSLTTQNCTGTPEPTGHALMILMIVPAEGEEHTISVDYRPATSEVFLDNIATGSWPVKFQGSYSVCPDFGRSLFELLGIDMP
jgi:hypothetical protein